jgi:hypothetical protein
MLDIRFSPVLRKSQEIMGSGSREEGFKDHIVVLVAADLESLPALALE